MSFYYKNASTGRDVFVWVGNDANRVEKLKAISFANQIRDEDHHGEYISFVFTYTDFHKQISF